jgi:hypothetical protein
MIDDDGDEFAEENVLRGTSDACDKGAEETNAQDDVLDATVERENSLLVHESVRSRILSFCLK